MKNWWLPLLIVVLFSSLVASDSGLKVEEIPKENVVVSDFGNVATYDLIINNTGQAGSFKIFTLVGVEITPSEYMDLPSGVSTVHISAKISDKILNERKGFLFFEYQIKERGKDLYVDKLPLTVVEVEDLLDITYDPLHPEDESVKATVHNRQNVAVSNVTIVFDSVFFRDSFGLDLAKNGTETFTIPLNKEGKEKLVAGPYLVSATVVTSKGEKQIGSLIDYLEKEGISVKDNVRGFVIRERTITKTNMGNTNVPVTVEMTKDAISRLFTTSSEEPVNIVRDGFHVTYTWQKTISPGESFEVRSTTNYTIPFLILIGLVVLGYVASMFYVRIVSIQKKVSLVRTRGGEFALKVTLRVRARRPVSNVQLTDSLPGMTKLFENFGKKPDQIDHNSRRLVWHIGTLASGEERMYSYVIYSKLNVVGRFELPLAHASYELNGEKKFSYSNRAFFAAEKS